MSDPGPRRALRIGLTGPIGCGKSTVGRWLEEHGGVLIDADEMVREVTAPGTPALTAILETFGSDLALPDGSLDRAALGRVVFADPDRLRELEAIVHPAVRPAIVARVADAEARGVPIVAVEAIRLVEGGLADACDEVWLVTCEPDDQRARLARRGSHAADADQRIVAQRGLAERLAPHVDRLIDTSGAADRARAVVESALEAALSRRA